MMRNFVATKTINLSIISIAVFTLTACTNPGETTTVGATAGGVLGAGMGAIVGSQTGDAGGGLLVGALAGSVAGAAVGNALQAHEEVMQRQDEAIERQQRIISSQQGEILELRKLSQDTINYSDSSNVASRPIPTGGHMGSISATNVKPHLSARNIPTETVRSANKWEQRSAEPSRSSVSATLATTPVTTPANTQSNVRPLPGSDCLKAESEIQKAQTQDDVSDKLFHYRRALRLCPGSPVYHNGLGELYLSLNRKADAQYEFTEALRVDPNFMPAKDNLIKIKKP